METEATSSGNHFGCTGEGQASVGVFGMMSSTLLAAQVCYYVCIPLDNYFGCLVNHQHHQQFQ